MRKGLLLAFSLGLLLTACDNSEKTGETFHIEVSADYDDIAFVQHFTGDSLNIVDTLHFEGGKAAGDISAALPYGFYQIKFPGEQILRFQASIGDQISISNVDLNASPLHYQVEGNKDSKKLRGMHMLMARTIEHLDSIDMLRQRIVNLRTVDPRKDSLLQHYHESDIETFLYHQDSLKSMIKADTSQLVNVFAFMHYIGQHRVLPVEQEYPYYLALDNGIGSTDKANHPLYDWFHKDVVNLRRTVERRRLILQASRNMEPGELAPSITSTNPAGEEVTLKSLRGNVVLIEFWKLDCGPCRQNHLHLAEMYEKYGDRNFEVFSVNLDGGDGQSEMLLRTAWRAAIEEDGMTWPNHVSDMNGWDSQIVLDYGVENIPRTILIDPRGVILGIDLHGEGLDRKLAQIL